MKRPYLLIQCTNYFEYIALKDHLKSLNYQTEYFDSTYTFKIHNIYGAIFTYIKQYAPTAKLTKVYFRNNRAIYTIIKD